MSTSTSSTSESTSSTSSSTSLSTSSTSQSTSSTSESTSSTSSSTSTTTVPPAGDRFWVGGTGDWSDATNHWALSSGGSPHFNNLPSSDDNVIVDSNSGFGSGGTITVDTGAFCRDFNSSSGHSYTITHGDNCKLSIYGSLLLEPTITIDISSWPSYFSFYSSSSETIDTNGVVLNELYFDGSGTFTLNNDFEITGQFYQRKGTFDANDHNITANNFTFFADTEYTPTVIMGSGTWEGSIWTTAEGNEGVVTITPETSTIKIVDSGENGINGGGKTYNNIWWAEGSGVGVNYITNNNTFNDFRISSGVDVYFEAGGTQRVSSFTAIGSVGNPIILNTLLEGKFTISKSSGIVECDYLDISNSNATGGATWYAGSHSNDTTNNDGWLFQDFFTTSTSSTSSSTSISTSSTSQSTSTSKSTSTSSTSQSISQSTSSTSSSTSQSTSISISTSSTSQSTSTSLSTSSTSQSTSISISTSSTSSSTSQSISTSSTSTSLSTSSTSQSTSISISTSSTSSSTSQSISTSSTSSSTSQSTSSSISTSSTSISTSSTSTSLSTSTTLPPDPRDKARGKSGEHRHFKVIVDKPKGISSVDKIRVAIK
jgi:hypothetical protein